MSYYEKYMKYKKKYLKLRQVGGKIYSIDSFDNEKIDFITQHIVGENSMGLTNENIEINFEILRNISGGSGDSVYFILNKNKHYVYKLFSVGDDEKKQKNLYEIKLHNEFYDYFKVINPNYVPCPKIFLYGEIKSITSNYYIMESIKSTKDRRSTLTNEIGYHCENMNRLTNESRSNILNIIYQLFYILFHMKQLKLKHCDLHTSNIMIENNDKDIKLIFFDEEIPISTTNFIVKIIDFGEGSHDRCRIERSLSSVLTELAIVCGIQSRLMATLKLLANRIISNSGDEDFDFFINIINILDKSNIVPLNKQSNVIDKLFESSLKIKSLLSTKPIHQPIIDEEIHKMFILFKENLVIEDLVREQQEPRDSENSEYLDNCFITNMLYDCFKKKHID